MKRTPLNPISKKKCKQNMIEISNFSHSMEICDLNCSKCDKPKVMHVQLRKPINPISKKKAQEIKDEKPIREALAKRANGCCEWCGKPEWQCLGGLHPHEMKFRSHGGKVSMDSVWICNTCHGNKGHNLRIVEH
jgi:hypothetical protein